MSVFLWSPIGKYYGLRGSSKQWSRLTKNRDTTVGTWYFGPIESLPTECLPKEGWIVDCHNVWDHQPTRGTIVGCTMPMCIISYVSYNGRLADAALMSAEGFQTGMPIIIVYRHEHKATVMEKLRKDGHNPFGLIDDRWANLQYTTAANFSGIHCLTATPEKVEEEVQLSEGSGVTVAKTQKELAHAIILINDNGLSTKEYTKGRRHDLHRQG